MRRRHLIALFGAFLAIGAARVSACLNDTAIGPGETEFRSRYESASASDTTAPPGRLGASAINLWGAAALATGSGLVAGSWIVGVRRGKREHT
jgi:hypothetical protein